MKKNNSGFSLVELIIVIAIMAVLIGVLAPQFLKNVEKSRQATDLQNVTELKTAIEVHVAETGSDSNCTITVTGGASGKVTIPDALVTGTDKIDGIAKETGLKSKSWPTGDVTYTYSVSSGWTNAECENTADPKYNMKDCFK